MKVLSPLIIAGVLSVTACSHAPAGKDPVRDLATERAGLDAFSTKWAAGYGAGDFESLRDLYEPDAWLMTRNQPARKGVDAILAYFAESRVEGSKAVISFEDEDETIDGDYAFKVAKWWLESPQAIGEPVRDSGRSLVIFKRGKDGVWRLWRDIDNNTPDVNFDNKPE